MTAVKQSLDWSLETGTCPALLCYHQLPGMMECHELGRSVMEIALFIGSGVVILAFIAGRFVLRKRKAKQAEAFAGERGWRYVPSDVGILDAYPQTFPFYSEGGSRSKPGLTIGDNSQGGARNLMHLNAGDYAGHSFTYTYTTYDRDSDNKSSSQNHYWHVVGLELPVPFPNLIVRRRRKLDALENRLTKPVEFPSPELTAAYTIHSEHPPAVFDIITPEMAQWLVGEEFRDEMVMQDHSFYVFRKGKQKFENIDSMLGQLRGFLSRIPAEAWQKAQGEYPRPQRVRNADALNVNQMKDAYREWRETR